jgi:hypothetical protein
LKPGLIKHIILTIETNLKPVSAEIIDVSERVLTSRITGQLTHSEFAAVQKQAAGLIQQQGKIRFLVLVENFAGIDQAGDWGDCLVPGRLRPVHREDRHRRRPAMGERGTAVHRQGHPARPDRILSNRGPGEGQGVAGRETIIQPNITTNRIKGSHP